MSVENGNGKSVSNGNGKKHRPPFQLCFAAEQEQGRSSMSKPKLPMSAYLITPKFYSRADRLQAPDDNEVQQISVEIESLKCHGPREKYGERLLESHSYGWYPEPLIPLVKTNRTVNHHRMTSQMVKVQGMLLNASRTEKEFERLVTQKAKAE